jgi:type IV pilus assembly protein PilP
MRKKANNRSFFLASLLVVALVFPGCKKKELPPPSPPSPKPAAKVPPPVQKQSTSARTGGVPVQSLDFSTKKDPFKPFMTEPVAQPSKARSAAAIARTEDLLPIQRYDVSKFRVSGVIVGLKENTALIVDPEGRGYVVREGMLIGNSDGRISRITPSSIEVVERYRDDTGHTRKKTVVLTLLKKK